MQLSPLFLSCSLALASGCLDLPEPSSTDVAALGNVPDVGLFQVQVTSAHSPSACMDLPGSGTGPAPYWLQQYPCNDGDNQRLRFEDMGGGQFRIHSAANNNLCLDVPIPSGVVSGQDVQFYNCHNGSNQRWTVAANDATYGVIHPAADSNLCLDVEDAATGIAKIQLYGCGSPVAANRLWKFRTLIATSQGRPCTGNVTIGTTTVLPGEFKMFAASGHSSVTCASAGALPYSLNCGATANWMIVNRGNGTGRFPITCFQQ
jgi:hypothetical protein